MAFEVIFPKYDESMTEGRIVEWKKKEGEWVEKGEALYVLETEKIIVEVEAPESGYLSSVMAKAGDVVPVGKVIALILEAGEEAPEIPVEVRLETKETVAPAGKVEAVEKFEATEEVVAIKASPIAKRIARDHNIDLSLVRGTGPEGRITKADVMQVVGGAKTAEATPMAQQEVVPLSFMRKTIARRLTESFQSAPHSYLSVEVDVKDLSQIREELIPSIEKLTGVRLTYTDLLLKITAQALEEHPEINVTWTADGIKRLSDVNLGLAISVEDGLIVPVIRQANTKSLAEIIVARADLVQRAAQGKISLSEMRGGSMTLTNVGMFGIDFSLPIINPPESCILAICRIVDKPVARNGQILIRPRMNLVLSFDHRVFDGVAGSRFLQRIKELIEHPRSAIF